MEQQTPLHWPAIIYEALGLCVRGQSEAAENHCKIPLSAPRSFVKIYSPKQFADYRAIFFGPPAIDVILQTWADLRLRNLSFTSSSGKSGSLFLFSEDGKLIIKTATKAESKFLRKITPQYFEYIKKNADSTLLSRFFAHFSVSVRGKTKYLLMMDNVFATPLMLHERYDTKGSLHTRQASAEEREQLKEKAILKDLDFVTRYLRLPAGVQQRLHAQIRNDSEFLAANNIMDYSLLIGIHKRHSADTNTTIDETVDPSTLTLDEHRRRGILSADRNEVYFMGIIDILQKYNTKKRISSLVKSIPYKRATLSSVPPNFYARRFNTFICERLTAGEEEETEEIAGEAGHKDKGDANHECSEPQSAASGGVASE